MSERAPIESRCQFCGNPIPKGEPIKEGGHPDCADASHNDPMTRARAAVCFLNAGSPRGRNDDVAIYGFLSIFHPGMSHQQKREFIRATHEIP